MGWMSRGRVCPHQRESWWRRAWGYVEPCLSGLGARRGARVGDEGRCGRAKGRISRRDFLKPCKKLLVLMSRRARFLFFVPACDF